MSTSDEKVMVVDFDDDHPQDWPATRKWTLMATIAIPLFLMPLSSTITTPTVNAIADEFHTTSSITGPPALSLFLLMYSMGTILLGPFSELYGRWPVLQVGSLFYLAFNLGAGFCTSMTQLLIFRLLSGTGASASLAVGSSMVGDVFRKEERGLPVVVTPRAKDRPLRLLLPGSGLGRLAQGDFTTVFTEHTGQYDIIMTLFFIDTARNLVSYLETIHRLLRPGGRWVNLGPLLYGTAPFVQLSLDEMLTLSESLGFEFQETDPTIGNLTLPDLPVRGLEVAYGRNGRGLNKNAYQAVLGGC